MFKRVINVILFYIVCENVLFRIMPRKKQSSDEYEPEHLSDEDVKGSSDGGSTPNEPEIPPDFLTERKAKVNRKEIVESEV